MPPQSTGSFGGNAGGASPELLAAIQRRAGGGGGATSQVTQGAPGYDPSTQPAQPPTGQVSQPQMGGSMPSQTMPPDQSQPVATPQMPFDQSEIKQIVGALSGRLKVLSSVQQAVTGVPNV